MTIAIKPTASGATIEQNGSSILTIDSSGNLTVPNNLSVTGTSPIPDALSTASGSAPSYSARAWVSLDGVSGTPNIDASGNISSITDNGVGDYTLNFTTAMSDNLYALVMSVRRGAARVFWTSTLSTSSARVIAANLSQIQGDETMSVAIFR
jgi:hypothetical protein